MGGCAARPSCLPPYSQVPRPADTDDRLAAAMEAIWQDVRQSEVTSFASAVPSEQGSRILLLAVCLVPGSPDSGVLESELHAGDMQTRLTIIRETPDGILLFSNAALPVSEMVLWDHRAVIHPREYHQSSRYPGVHAYAVTDDLIGEDAHALWQAIGHRNRATMWTQEVRNYFGAFPIVLVAAKQSDQWSIHWGIGTAYDYAGPALPRQYLASVDRLLEMVSLYNSGFLDSTDLEIRIDDQPISE